MKNIPVRDIRTTSEASLGRFSIRKIEEVMGGQEMQHDLHRHNFYFVLFVKAGDGIHEIDFISHKVKNGSVFFLRPGQVHRLQLQLGASGYLVEFDSLFAQAENKSGSPYLRKASSKNLCTVEPGRFLRLSNILSAIFEEQTHKQEGYLEIIKSQLKIFCIELSRQSLDPKRIAKNEGNYTQERFEQFFDLLEKKISEWKSPAQYASQLNLSAYQLNSITKSVTGKTVTQLIEEQIVLEAKRYLLATPNQVKDIAWSLGYEDASYFIRFFKKKTGHSPEAFRKNFG